MKKLLLIIALISFISLRADADVERQRSLRSLIENGEVESLVTAIEQGDFSLNAVLNRNGCSLLHWAALHGNSELVIALLALGADPHINCVYGRTALHFAAINGDAPTIIALLDAGIDPNSATHTFKTTPLEITVYHNHPEAVALLLEAGADPRTKDWCGDDALAMAKKYNREDNRLAVIEVLEKYLKTHEALKTEKEA